VTRTLVDLVLLKMFQNRSVSSPAPVTMDSPSGDIASKNKQLRCISPCVVMVISYWSTTAHRIHRQWGLYQHASKEELTRNHFYITEQSFIDNVLLYR